MSRLFSFKFNIQSGFQINESDFEGGMPLQWLEKGHIYNLCQQKRRENVFLPVVQTTSKSATVLLTLNTVYLPLGQSPIKVFP